MPLTSTQAHGCAEWLLQISRIWFTTSLTNSGVAVTECDARSQWVNNGSSNRLSKAEAGPCAKCPRITSDNFISVIRSQLDMGCNQPRLLLVFVIACPGAALAPQSQPGLFSWLIEEHQTCSIKPEKHHRPRCARRTHVEA